MKRVAPFVVVGLVWAASAACTSFGAASDVDASAAQPSATSSTEPPPDAALPMRDADVTRDAEATDARPPDGAVRTSRLLWVVSPPSRGAFRSIAEADGLCQSSAAPLGVARARAVLVGDTRRACATDGCSGGPSEHLDWPLAPSTDYVRPDGTPIGRTTANAIFLLSLASSVGEVDGLVWTGLAVKADNSGCAWTTSPSTCSSWSSLAPTELGAAAYHGPTYRPSAFAAFLDDCSKGHAIYCAETN